MRAPSLIPFVLWLAVAGASACGNDGPGGGGAAGSPGGSGGAGGTTGGSGGSGGTTGGSGGSTGGSGGSTGGSGGSGNCTGTYDYCADGKVETGTCDPCVYVDCDMPGNYISCGGDTCVFYGLTCPDEDAGASDAADGEAGSVDGAAD